MDDEPILGNNIYRVPKQQLRSPPQNDVDVHANDLNFVAIAKDGKLVGFNVSWWRLSNDARRYLYLCS